MTETELRAACRPDWLTEAEVSRPARPAGTDRWAVSFFFRDETLFEAFCARMDVPDEMRREMRGARATFDLVPRHWLKLSFADGERTALSRYYAVPPSLRYPVTTLRLLGRRLGLAETSRLEPALSVALARSDTSWFVSRKEDTVRLSCRLPGPLLPAVLGGLSAHGFLTERLVCAHLDVASRLDAERVYVTFQPDAVDACSVDYRSDQRVGTFVRDELGIQEEVDYVKCRIDGATLAASWTWYGPWA